MAPYSVDCANTPALGRRLIRNRVALDAPVRQQALSCMTSTLPSAPDTAAAGLLGARAAALE